LPPVYSTTPMLYSFITPRPPRSTLFPYTTLFRSATGAERKESDKVRADLFEAARELGAPHIKVGAGEGVDGHVPLSHLASAFSDLADEAEESGIKLALEATPFSHMKTIHETVEVVNHSNSPSSGILVDI